jgi:L-lysine 2,3-aminomutase
MKTNVHRPNGHSDIPIRNYKAYSLRNFRDIPQMDKLSEEVKFAIEVVGSVLPFKVNNYVIEELINWDNAPDDPIFVLTFPVKELLTEEHFNTMADLIQGGASKKEICSRNMPSAAQLVATTGRPWLMAWLTLPLTPAP